MIITTQAIGWGNNSNKTLDLPNGGKFIEKFNFASGLYNVQKVAAGIEHAIALTENGQVLAWGTGDLDFGQKNIPNFNYPAIDVAVDQFTTYILDSNGTVTGCGQMFLENIVPKLTGIKSMSVNSYYGLAVTLENKITGWGIDYYNRVYGGYSLTGVKKISAGWTHAVALLNDNTITGWGDDSYGQLSFPAILEDIYDIYAHDYCTVTFHSGAGSGIQVWGAEDGLFPNPLPTGLSGIKDADMSSLHGLLLTSTPQSTGSPPKQIPPCLGVYYYDY
jgi:hypothetical protein